MGHSLTLLLAHNQKHKIVSQQKILEALPLCIMLDLMCRAIVDIIFHPDQVAVNMFGTKASI